jgi:PTS system ascorbate-specific IIA component
MSILQSAFAEGSIAVGTILENRDQAILFTGNLLVESGRVKPEYSQAMLEAIEIFGPYIVIAPGIALAHAKPSKLVISSGMSLVVPAEPIAFGSERNDPVSLVFGLAAIDHESHQHFMAALANRLSDESFVNSLLNAVDSDQIRTLLA